MTSPYQRVFSIWGGVGTGGCQDVAFLHVNLVFSQLKARYARFLNVSLKLVSIPSSAYW